MHGFAGAPLWGHHFINSPESSHLSIVILEGCHSHIQPWLGHSQVAHSGAISKHHAVTPRVGFPCCPESLRHTTSGQVGHWNLRDSSSIHSENNPSPQQPGMNALIKQWQHLARWVFVRPCCFQYTQTLICHASAIRQC